MLNSLAEDQVPGILKTPMVSVTKQLGALPSNPYPIPSGLQQVDRCRSGAIRTSGSQSRDPGSNPLAAVLKLRQFLSPHAATVHSAV